MIEKILVKYLCKGVVIIILSSIYINANGQATFSDTLQVSPIYNEHSPKKAALYSAIIPGLGQIYNKKYWKLPIVYGGIGALVYFIDFNSQKYSLYKKAYIDKIYNIPNGAYTNPEDFPNWEAIPNFEEQLKNFKDYYHRNRDLSYILLGVTYLLNIVDATVDAHMFNYDISKDLSLKLEPAVIQDNLNCSIGMKLSLKFN